MKDADEIVLSPDNALTEKEIEEINEKNLAAKMRHAERREKERLEADSNIAKAGKAAKNAYKKGIDALRKKIKLVRGKYNSMSNIDNQNTK